VKLVRRRFIQLAAGAAALPAAPAGTARAGAYPARPVHLVVPYPAGGAPDFVGRLAAQWLSERLGQQFIVDNRAGAASNIGTEMVAHSPPDGYASLPGH
jgi:tripartite-type tricarboxylate transporter receptor subunit TctC